MPRAAASTVLALGATTLIHVAVLTRQPVAAWLALQLLATMLCLDGLLARRAWVWAAWLTCGVGLALLVRTGGAPLVLYLPSIVIPLALAAAFGSSLGGGREPLITSIARRARGEHPPELVRYTRGLTVLWTAVFVALAATSAALAVFATPVIWSGFANFGSYVLICMLVGMEYVWRLRRFPDYPHPGFREYLGILFHARPGRKNL